MRLARTNDEISEKTRLKNPRMALLDIFADWRELRVPIAAFASPFFSRVLKTRATSAGGVAKSASQNPANSEPRSRSVSHTRAHGFGFAHVPSE